MNSSSYNFGTFEARESVEEGMIAQIQQRRRSRGRIFLNENRFQDLESEKTEEEVHEVSIATR
jgi:hypothetical protein